VAKSEKTRKKSTSNKKSTKDVVQKVMESTIAEKPVVKKERDLNEMIRVVNITNSKLVYISKTSPGYRIDWDEYLDENWMEYKELINMRNSQRRFFEEPWIICDWDVLEDLRVDKYYKNIIDLENLDDVFKKSPDELAKILDVVPNGIKKLIADRAYELRREKKLDSLSIIETIEKKLNIDLSV
jgi:hypothetical protein